MALDNSSVMRKKRSRYSSSTREKKVLPISLRLSAFSKDVAVLSSRDAGREGIDHGRDHLNY
jgi:hypothetical protein